MKLTPYDWPQDELEIPPGLGVMTQVEGNNSRVVRREGRTFSQSFDYPAGSVPFNATKVIPTDQDGDFWCQNIYMAAFENSLGVLQQRPLLPYWSFLIRDVRTGNPLSVGGGIPASFLSVNQDFAGVPPPGGTRLTSTLAQPFCFTRNGGIEITIIDPVGYPAFDTWCQLAFGGWTEYAHASE